MITLYSTPQHYIADLQTESTVELRSLIIIRLPRRGRFIFCNCLTMVKIIAFENNNFQLCCNLAVCRLILVNRKILKIKTNFYSRFLNSSLSHMTVNASHVTYDDHIKKRKKIVCADFVPNVLCGKIPMIVLESRIITNPS